MMDDINCPYCNAGNKIDHYDDYGYGDGQYKTECHECGKLFGFTTCFSTTYSAIATPCANGDAKHVPKEDLIRIVADGIELYKAECAVCGLLISERQTPPKKMEEK